MSSFNRSVSSNRRALSIASPRANRTTWVSKWFCLFLVVGFVFSFIFALGGYEHVLPNLRPAFHGYNTYFNASNNACNVFDGMWEPDESYPLYNASECPFAEQGFNCLGNGRSDTNYLKWRWKPKNCNIPRFNVGSALEMLRGRRVVFVGDSMSRSQWESLICLLMTGVEDKRSVYEVNGNQITKQIRFLGVRFSSFNFTVEFFRSVFLVRHNWVPRYGPKRVRSTLELDKLDDISNKWINSDVLLFNSGQWWVPGKLFGTGCYFQVGNSVKLGMSIASAYRMAVETWASWIETFINPNRTHVFFRTFEPSHWSNLTLRECNVTQQPLTETRGRHQSIYSDTVFEVVKKMTKVVPVNVLQITTMSAFRSDAHVGDWKDKPSVSDCSHWCLPGVPDVWNEILLSYLFTFYGYGNPRP